MRATLAHDLQSPPIEYFFTNTVTGEFREPDSTPFDTDEVTVVVDADFRTIDVLNGVTR